jgi:hypothetical protein
MKDIGRKCYVNLGVMPLPIPKVSK